MVGQIGGPTQAVAVQGNYAYVGVGLRLVVLDISNPVTSTEVGSTTPFPYFVEDVVVSGTLAYVAAGGAGLRVVDVLTPTAPVEVGFWDSPGYAEGVAVAGNTVYLADGPYGLWTVDVSDPTHPQKIGSAYDMNYAFEVAVSGQYAYIAAAGAGLLVADVADPAQPVEAGSLDTSGYAYGVTISGTLAYIADAWEGLQVVNVTNPLSPTVMGVCNTPGWALNVAVAGVTAYVADGAFGLRIVDVSDPAHAHEAGAYEIYGLARRVAAAEGTAYVADLRTGLRAVDVADPTQATQVGLYSPLADARRVAVAGDYAYVAAGFSGLRVIDVSDPAHPREVATHDTEGAYATAVVISGTYAYLATYIHPPYDLLVLDISNPAYPTRVCAIHWEKGGAYRDLALQRDILYVADESGLRLISVSDPTDLTELGFIRLDQNDQATVGVAVSGTLAYVADAADRVKIVDVSNPYSPTLMSVCCSNWHWVAGVAVSGNTLYAAVHTAGLHIADVSDPDHPVEIGYYDTPGVAGEVLVSGTEAYVGDSGGGMVVVNVSSPSSPTTAANHDTVGLAQHVALAGNHAFVADGHGGLAILERTAGGTTGRLESPSDNPSGLSLADTAADVFIHARISEMAGSRITASIAAPRSNASEFSAPAILVSVTYTVTSVLDSGPGTLRQALLNAETGDTVTFDPTVFSPTNPVTITLESPLPLITQGYLTIDASNAGVILNGSATPPGTSGLVIPSDGNTIQGLQILHFLADGVDVGGRYNWIGGDSLQGSGPLGEGNLLGGNGGAGVHIGGIGVMSNTIVGNLIGLNANGEEMGNEVGVSLCCEASNNRIGGQTVGERNIISDNSIGVVLGNKGVNGNVIIGNYIGTDISGTHALGNSMVGIMIWDGPCGNIVGGTGPGKGNLISGNGGGVGISGIDANHNAVIGNFIGTDATGTTALGNSTGIGLCGAGFSRVEGNVISGNANGAIDVCDWGWPHNLILGNYIGTNISGTRALGNRRGISLGGWHVLIGGATVGEGNVICCSQGPGVSVESAGTEYNYIAGNAIGTDASGSISLGNGWAGVGLWDYAAQAFVQGNTIAFNGGTDGWDAGVFVQNSLSNPIRRNSIYGNVGRGIFLADGGNNLLPVPVIVSVTETSVSGTACPGCTVEVFSDAEDEGRVYEGSIVADDAGDFTFDKGNAPVGPHVTATATDLDGNTSEFSAPYEVPIVLPRFEIGKTYTSSRIAGLPVTYTLTVTNVGDETATGVIVTDIISAYLSEHSGTAGFPWVGWRLGPIAPGGVVTATFRATLPCMASLDIVNDDYGVRGSDQGVSGPAGDPVSFTVLTPTITASLTHTPGAIVVGDTVYFTATADTDGTPLSYTWDFSAGPVSGGLTASHTYTRAGAYTVVFTAADTCGYTVAQTATVVAIPTCVMVSSVTFTYAPPSPVVRSPVTFTAAHTPTDATRPITYTWDFGDGVTDTVTTAAMQHIYTVGGMKTVSVIADNPCTPGRVSVAPRDVLVAAMRAFLPLVLKSSP